MIAFLTSLAILLPSASSPVLAADTLDGSGVFAPDQVLLPPGGPELYLYNMGTTDVVALRVSVPLREVAGEAGAGQILRGLAEERMRSVASRIGARTRVLRSPDALIYEVAGPSEDLDFLAWVLREGLKAPDGSRFAEYRREAQIEAEQRLETPEGVLALRLRDRLAPSDPPVFGTVTALERMTPDRLQRLWQRTHALDVLMVVVVGSVPAEVILASLTNLGLPASVPDPTPPSGTAAGQPSPALELIRHWVGEARPIPGGRDPRALVATRMIAEALRAAPGDYEVGVELWEVDRDYVLVLSGASYPRSRPAMLTRIDGLIAETRGRVSDESVRRHVAGLRAELLEVARTPWGLADVVGHAIDVEESPDRVQTLIAELGELRGDDVARFLEELANTPSLREEIDP